MKQIKPKIIGWEILYNDGEDGREGTVYETLDEILSFVIDPEIELFENGADIRLGEKKIGSWLGNYQSSIDALE